MSLRRIRLLALAVPAGGLVAFEAVRHVLLHPLEDAPEPHWMEHVISGVLLFLGALAFTTVVFRLLGRLHRHLEALNEAGLALTGERSAARAVHDVAELARRVAGAPYARVRLAADGSDPIVSGTHPGGPELALPLATGGTALGEIVVAFPPGERVPRSGREALETFAAQAATAIDNARLSEQVEEIAALRERTRIGMDLHDGVMQRMYGIGLALEEALETVRSDPDAAVALLGRAREQLRTTSGVFRSYVYGLHRDGAAAALDDALARVVEEFPGEDDRIETSLASRARLPAALAASVVHIVREALSNALRHSGARRIRVASAVEGDRLAVCVEDDGRGFDPDAAPGGLGLAHMRERAAWCGCRLEIRSAPGRGTLVRVTVRPAAKGATSP